MNDKRNRNYFLTLNPEATCYKTFEKVLDKAKYFAWIKHDRDTDDNGELKHEHIHLILCYPNPRTFSAIQKDFDGAHIEVANNVVSCIKYLVHNTSKSNEDGKYQYPMTDIHTSNKEYTKQSIEARDIEPFDPNEIITYLNQGCMSLIDFYLRFGCAINPYANLIERLARDYTYRACREIITKEVEDDAEPSTDLNNFEYLLDDNDK